jgi:hypothetical protein
MYFSPGDGIDLSSVRKWWRGRLPNVWVMSFEDLNRLLEGKDAEERGELVIDALGLPIRNGVGESNRPELVAVKYPEHFSIGCVQPTTLDAWWIDSGGYYLSYGNEDAWGRTHSLTGNRPSQRERVHSHFKNLTPGYSTYYIGVVRLPVERREKLLEEAYRRFAAVAGPAGA